MDLLADAYLWIKAGHVISVIAWMAAMLYLPRLFVYHAGVAADGPESAVFKVMERRLARAIMTPAMIATWVFGLALLATPGVIDWSGDYWFHAKFALVIVLSGVHGHLLACARRFANDANTRSAGYFRIVNEVPTLIMIAVVIFVIVRPF
jgi:putative membrane protein